MADNMTRGRGAEGAGRGKREADNTTRGRRGRTTQGKEVVDDTTRGLLLRRQKMVEPPRACVCRHQRCRASVTVMQGEAGARTHHCRSCGAIDNDDEDAASKNDSNHDVVFFVTVTVGAYDVVCGGDGSGDNGSNSWLQLVVGQGVQEEEDQMMAWRAEPHATDREVPVGRCGGGRESSLSLELLYYVDRP
jgi:hypothetical protein